MKIQIGGMNKEKYLTAFKKADIHVSDWAKELISKIEFQKKKETFDVEIVTVAGLGFPDGASRKDIYDRAKEKGYSLLPAEAALAFRLAYKEKELFHWNLIGTEPITDSGGDPDLLYASRYVDGRWLDADDGDPGGRWDGGGGFAFAVSKHPQPLDTPILRTDLDALALRISALESDMEKVKKIINL